MYQIHVRTWVNNVRQADSIIVKEYVRLRNAEKAAKSYICDEINHNGEHIVREAVILPTMSSVARNEAREAYCNGKDVWVDDEYGRYRLRPSWEYGSHDTRERLFTRSIEQSVGWRYPNCNYTGSYYIAY